MRIDPIGMGRQVVLPLVISICGGNYGFAVFFELLQRLSDILQLADTNRAHLPGIQHKSLNAFVGCGMVNDINDVFEQSFLTGRFAKEPAGEKGRRFLNHDITLQ